MDWETALTIALSFNSLLILALSSWFWSWKSAMEKDVRDTHDTLIRVNSTLEKLNERLGEIRDVPARILTLEHHMQTVETAVASNHRSLATVNEQRVKDAKTSALFEVLYDKFVGGSPPEGYRAIIEDEG